MIYAAVLLHIGWELLVLDFILHLRDECGVYIGT